MDYFISAIERAFGSTAHPSDLTTGQMSLRAVVVFVLWLVIVRAADKRMLGKYSAFDVLVAVILGAVLGRTINGSAPFWGSMAAAAVLVALHWAMAFLSSRWHAFGHLVKGRPCELVRDGVVDARELRRNFITEDDLEEMLRLRARIASPAEARLAVLERNGQISALPRPIGPRVVETQVQAGVQTIRVELSGG
jgi:uncharacterized membrane protein YcaP (DUF421 family)